MLHRALNRRVTEAARDVGVDVEPLGLAVRPVVAADLGAETGAEVAARERAEPGDQTVHGGAALVRNADRAGYASLRAKGSDSLGNTFQQTVIRAYRVG